MPDCLVPPFGSAGEAPDPKERTWYAAKAIENNWSRNILVMQIETRLMERQANAVTNFKESLPEPQSDLARESLKDPYRLDSRRSACLCKSKNNVGAEYALRDTAKPLGVAEYELMESLPEPLQTSLPTIDRIER